MSEHLILSGIVRHDGEGFLWDREQDARTQLLLRKGERVIVEIRSPKARRSTRQNAWYWVGIVPAVADYLSIGRVLPLSKEQAHEVLKAACIVTEETALGSVPKSSAALSVDEFASYCESIRAHAASEWGLNIPGPEW